MKWCPIFDSSPLLQFSKCNNFLLVCWFLARNLFNFASLPWKLHNRYCHKYWATHVYNPGPTEEGGRVAGGIFPHLVFNGRCKSKTYPSNDACITTGPPNFLTYPCFCYLKCPHAVNSFYGQIPKVQSAPARVKLQQQNKYLSTLQQSILSSICPQYVLGRWFMINILSSLSVDLLMCPSWNF